MNNIRPCSSFNCCDNISAKSSREASCVFVSCHTNGVIFNNTKKRDSGGLYGRSVIITEHSERNIVAMEQVIGDVLKN